ncbi:MAG: aspartate--tRNA ligase [Candidatus Eremiobacteraeota bacterium]|nr:aspartate--tRNA ligase [Candidatus Eremiobacteraeota bacterium]
MKARAFLKRTKKCGELRIEDVGNEVIINGWVNKRRDLGGLIFVDLRDRFGIVQVVFNPTENPELFAQAEKLRSEYVVAIKGVVGKRPGDTRNSNLGTGDIEITAREMEILNTSKTPPFVIKDDIKVDESLRLKYRYLDLRRPEMLRNMYLRHKIVKAVRDFLDNEDFLEIETPMLIRATPEGARDFLVPSRMSAGKFYALPQSPQLFKQILMVSGMEKYFQIARCFRDEDLRADRQPEFTQIDIEMSFVERDDILGLAERMMKFMFKTVLGHDLETPFPRLSWEDAMNRYGIDKPDTRFGMEIVDVTEIAAKTDFQVFRNVIEGGGVIKGIKLPSCAGYSRKRVDELSEFVKKYGAHGILPIALKEGGNFKSPLAKATTDEQKREIIEAFDAKEGDLIALLAGKADFVLPILGKLRLEMGNQLDLIDKSKFNFLFVIDFPMFHFNEEENRIDSEHHPFTSPKTEDMHLIDTDPLKVKADAYDMVLNGHEVASGSIRIHSKDLQKKILEIIGISSEEADQRFGFLLEAFDYGAPPHGGIAPGLDRIIAEICGKNTIREVIAFPKNTAGDCPMTGAPVEIEDEQLGVLKIKVKK